MGTEVVGRGRVGTTRVGVFVVDPSLPSTTRDGTFVGTRLDDSPGYVVRTGVGEGGDDGANKSSSGVTAPLDESLAAEEESDNASFPFLWERTNPNTKPVMAAIKSGPAIKANHRNRFRPLHSPTGTKSLPLSGGPSSCSGTKSST